MSNYIQPHTQQQPGLLTVRTGIQLKELKALIISCSVLISLLLVDVYMLWLQPFSTVQCSAVCGCSRTDRFGLHPGLGQSGQRETMGCNTMGGLARQAEYSHQTCSPCRPGRPSSPAITAGICLLISPAARRNLIMIVLLI